MVIEKAGKSKKYKNPTTIKLIDKYVKLIS